MVGHMDHMAAEGQHQSHGAREDAMTFLIRETLVPSPCDSPRLREASATGCPSKGHPEACTSNKV